MWPKLGFANRPLSCIKGINKTVRHLKQRNVYYWFQKLKKSSVRVQFYSDTSFISNFDLSRPIRYCIFLKDKFYKISPIILDIIRCQNVEHIGIRKWGNFVYRWITHDQLYKKRSTLAGKIVHSIIYDDRQPISIWHCNKTSRNTSKWLSIDLEAM